MTCDGEQPQEALNSPQTCEPGKKGEIVSPELQDVRWLNSGLVVPNA